MKSKEYIIEQKVYRHRRKRKVCRKRQQRFVHLDRLCYVCSPFVKGLIAKDYVQETFVLFSIVMVAIVGAGVFSYVMALKKLTVQDNSLSPDIKVWGMTPLSFLGAIVLAFIVFGFFDSYPYQKSISEKNKQIKSLEAKFDSLNMELCRMKGQLDNMRMVSDDKKSSKSCVNTLRQGTVTVLSFHVTMLRFEGLAKL